MEANGTLELEVIRKFWFEEVKPPIMKALDKVPEDKLDWMPAKDMISLGNIFMHIAEASDWWITTIIDGKESTDYTPCPSFPRDKIKTLLDEHWDRLENYFARCPEMTRKEIPHQWRGETHIITGRWIMMHLLEHDIHHRSQINHYLRIMGIEPPKI